MGDREVLEDEIDILEDAIQALQNVHTDLAKTVAYLRTALMKHGHHTPICPLYNEVDGECLCGLRNAIEGS